MRWRTIAIACLGLAVLSAGAQVHRCKNPNGELVFSDRPCTNNQTGGMIQLRPSAREIERERRQAAEANARKQDRQDAQAMAAPLPPTANAAQAAPQNPAVHPVACRRAQRELELAGSLVTLTPEKKNVRMREEQEKVNKACGTNDPVNKYDQRIVAKAPPPPPPTEPEGSPNPRLKKCIGDTCTDTNGVRDKKDYGQPGSLRGPNGQNCRQDPYKGLVCQ